MSVKQKEKIEIISIMDYLNNLSDEELNYFYENIIDDDFFDFTRDQLIEEINLELMTRMIISFQFIVDDEVDRIEKILNDQNIDDLYDELFENYMAVENNGVFYVFSELKELCESHHSDVNNNVKCDLVISAYLRSNGVLKIDKLVELVKETGFVVTKDDIFSYAEEYKAIIENDLIYVNFIACNLNENNMFMKAKEDFDYRVYSVEDSYNIMFKSINCIEILAEFFEDKVSNKEVIKEISNLLYFRICAGDDFVDDIMNVLKVNNIKLSKNDKEKFIDLAYDLYFDSPIWSLNGNYFSDCDSDCDCDFESLDREGQICVYCNCYLLLNGVIEIDNLLNILNNEHNLSVTKEELIDLIGDNVVDDKYLCLSKYDSEDLNIILSSKKIDEHYIIKDVDDFIDDLEIVFRNVFEILEEYNIDLSLSNDINMLVQFSIFDEKELSDLLARFKIKLSSQKIKQLYMDIDKAFNDSRLWSLNGFKSYEINKK